MTMKNNKKQCSIAIIGQPNAGKSTLINQIFDKKVSIVSYKPQTTRNSITALYENDKIKILFFDTPGFHKPKTKLDSFLNSQIKASLKKVNFVLFLVDSCKGFTDDDEILLNIIKGYAISKIIYVFTKSDLNKTINLCSYHKKLKSNNLISINSFNKKHIHNLIDFIYSLTNDNDHILLTPNADDDDFLIREIIREQSLYLLKYEVPHSLAIEILNKEYNTEKKLLTINANLIVEKKSQKQIVIGKNGEMIKKIGTKSRHELLKIFDCKIMLKLFVKVKLKWRNDENVLASLGYFNK